MKLSTEEIEATYYGLAGFIRLCELDPRRSKPPPSEVLDVYRKFDTAVRMSRRRHESCCSADDQEQSEPWIGVAATAELLGRPGHAGSRWVQRHANELGGILNGGRWFFQESAVIDYVERHEAADGAT